MPGPQTTVSPPRGARTPSPCSYSTKFFGGVGVLGPSLRAAGAPGLGAAPQHLAAFGVPALVPQSHRLPPGCPPRAPLPHPMLGWGPGTIPRSTCLVAAALLHPAGTVPPPEPPSPFMGSREGIPQPQPPPCCSSCKQEGAQHSTDTPSKALFLKKPIALRLPPALGGSSPSPPGPAPGWGQPCACSIAPSRCTNHKQQVPFLARSCR